SLVASKLDVRVKRVCRAAYEADEPPCPLTGPRRQVSCSALEFGDENGRLMGVEGGVAVGIDELQAFGFGRGLLDQRLDDAGIVEPRLSVAAFILDLYVDHTRKGRCCITPKFSCKRVK